MEITFINPLDIPKCLRKGIKEEPKPLARAVHIGRAIREKTLGQSKSPLLLHGHFDDPSVEDFGQEPKSKETVKKTEQTE